MMNFYLPHVAIHEDVLSVSVCEERKTETFNNAMTFSIRYRFVGFPWRPVPMYPCTVQGAHNHFLGPL